MKFGATTIWSETDSIEDFQADRKQKNWRARINDVGVETGPAVCLKK